MIPLSVPNLSGKELAYVTECLETGWISSVGSYVTQFEEAVAEYLGVKHAIATVNGTAALHIALQLAGVTQDDYVLMPNITFVATANAVRYTGAEPILFDANPHNWQLDLDLLEQFLATSCERSSTGELLLKRNGRRIAAILPVHVQGNIGDMNRLLSIASDYQLPLVEDAAESMGSTYRGAHAGTFGLMACLSFNGNKIISTGGGGMLVTNNTQLAERAKHLTTTAKTDPMEYFHDEVGYNYRLVNVLAAIGVAQMEQLPGFVRKKQAIGEFYRSELAGCADIEFQQVLPEVTHNNWLFTIKTGYQKKLVQALNNEKIVCRPFWMPMNMLPMYEACIYVSEKDHCRSIHSTCLAIPCSTNITDEELGVVATEIKRIVP